ncbi:D-alanyl-D-alanine carboxypeptidase family protein [Nodosilinea sp. E11]|uniref:M15 family metallopeptidase n=1 Tax=Nodosilinea sp. E11 TaxID=3037479 RepID=UPI0029344358|nr:D-alanyl-D-alanine carboxypeptidase family protein [Nodosilinea sp. E11]WOD40583.1 D-alanyl-D-alanine carboxypeptidase family protein [Nodosilinea sp. E11]
MSPIDDIPQAARDLPLYPEGAAQPPWLRRTRLLRRVLGLTLLALTAGGLVAWYQTNGFSAVEFARPFETMVNRSADTANGTNSNVSDLDVAVQLAPSSRRLLLGHRAFEEAPADDLVTLSANRSIRLRSAAASEYEAMAQAAAQEGIRLVPLSGFRSQAEQETIFFNLKAQRGQDAQTRAEVSAPPGYSEHHTGYAIDVGDGNQAGTHLNDGFADTRTYQWMETNAVRYGYELSFPADNFQGVAFEPWHWRFVGDRTSLETFYSE